MGRGNTIYKKIYKKRSVFIFATLADINPIYPNNCFFIVILVQPQYLSFDEFLVHYGDDDRYELIDGELFNLEPTGPYEEVIAFISQQINVEIVRQDLDFLFPIAV